MKSEPEEYGIDDLARDKRDWWTGVRNYQARNFMKNDMKKGDGVFVLSFQLQGAGRIRRSASLCRRRSRP